MIAHETGHMIGGHQQRMRDRLETGKVLAAVGILLGAGAMAAGGDLGSAAGQAIVYGAAGFAYTLPAGLQTRRGNALPTGLP